MVEHELGKQPEQISSSGLWFLPLAMSCAATFANASIKSLPSVF
jgi:hypothetical protein